MVFLRAPLHVFKSSLKTLWEKVNKYRLYYTILYIIKTMKYYNNFLRPFNCYMNVF